jgi:hypothetical protein
VRKGDAGAEAMAIRSHVSAVSAFLASTITLACILGSSFSSTSADEPGLERIPTEYIIVIGMVYEADGVTPAADCVVNVTNKNTGDWALAATDYTGAYVLGTNVFETYVYGGEVINVTSTKGSQIGWAEGVANWPYVQIDVILSAPESSFTLRLVRGWNMMCLPFANLDYTAGSLGLGTGDVIAGYNSTTQRYDQMFIVGFTPPGLDFAIRPSTGYDIFASAPRNLTLHGTLSSSETRLIVVPSTGGWVQLGLASLTPRHAHEIPPMYVGGTLKTLCKWDPVLMSFKSYIPGLPLNDFVIYPGEGFWGWVDASGTFSYQP